LQQQQATPTTSTTTTNKDTFGSPKLPTVKNNAVEVTTTACSPQTSSTSSNQNPIPMVQSPEISSNRSDSATPPPPPPPPPKENIRVVSETKNSKHERHKTQMLANVSSITPITTTTTATTTTTTHDHHSIRSNKCKSRESGSGSDGKTPMKMSTSKHHNSERLIKRTIKLERPEPISFIDLPDLNKYSEYFSPSVAEFHTVFYCNTLENQIALAWDETMNLLHTEGYRSKFNVSVSKQNVDCEDSKLDISSKWVDALNTVVLKVESLQDSNMSSESRVTNTKDNDRNSNENSKDIVYPLIVENDDSPMDTSGESNVNVATSGATSGIDLKLNSPIMDSVKGEASLTSTCKNNNKEGEDDPPPPPPPPPRLNDTSQEEINEDNAMEMGDNNCSSTR